MVLIDKRVPLTCMTLLSSCLVDTYLTHGPNPGRVSSQAAKTQEAFVLAAERLAESDAVQKQLACRVYDLTNEVRGRDVSPRCGR